MLKTIKAKMAPILLLTVIASVLSKSRERVALVRRLFRAE